MDFNDLSSMYQRKRSEREKKLPRTMVHSRGSEVVLPSVGGEKRVYQKVGKSERGSVRGGMGAAIPDGGIQVREQNVHKLRGNAPG